MKKYLYLCTLFFVLFLSACKENVDETQEEIVITFYGVTEHIIEQGESEIDLRNNVEAKDQFGQSYTFEVIESINVDVIARYEVIYRAEHSSKIFEKTTFVDVILNVEVNQQLHDELVQKLSTFQGLMNQNPYRYVSKNYDPSDQHDYMWVMSVQRDYLSTQIQELLLINPSITTTPETFNLILEHESGYVAVPVKDNYTYQPNFIDEYERITLLNEDDFVLGIVKKESDGYRVLLAYQDLSSYKGQKNLLGEIYDLYGYDLRQKDVSVMIKFILTEDVVSLDVYYDIKDSDYDYYASFTYSLIVNEDIDLNTLSQVDARHFTDVLFPIQKDVHHEVVYDMMRTRYFKIEVEKNKSYEIRGLSIATLKYYNDAFESVNLNMKNVQLWSGTRKWFTSPIDGDLYIKYERNNSPIHDLFDFYVGELLHEPVQETITLNDNNYQVIASFVDSIKLVIPVLQGVTYRLSFDRDELDLYFESGVVIETYDDYMHMTNNQGTEVVIYIYSIISLSWEPVS